MQLLVGETTTDFGWRQALLPGRFGGLGLRAAAGARYASAAYWAAYDLHAAIMPDFMAALGRPAIKHHPEHQWAEAARQQLADHGVAVALGARAELTSQASSAYSATPWQHDASAAQACSARDPARHDSGSRPRSLARHASFFSKLLARILACAEA
eukprot:2449945-Lingulodinium_polyedra.AAC.1